MAKTSGLGWTTLSADDNSGTPVDIKNDVTNLSWSMPRGVQEVTGVDKSAPERILLLSDFSVTLNGVFNSGTSHGVFKTVPTETSSRTLSMTVNSQSLNTEVLFTDYALTRSDSGELTWSVPGVLANGTAPSWT